MRNHLREEIEKQNFISNIKFFISSSKFLSLSVLYLSNYNNTLISLRRKSFISNYSILIEIFKSHCAISANDLSRKVTLNFHLRNWNIQGRNYTSNFWNLSALELEKQLARKCVAQSLRKHESVWWKSRDVKGYREKSSILVDLSVAGLICRGAARIRQLPVPPEKSGSPFWDILTVL